MITLIFKVLDIVCTLAHIKDTKRTPQNGTKRTLYLKKII
jgi:hypothetical protein